MLSLLSEDRIQQALRLMGQPPYARLIQRSPGKSASELQVPRSWKARWQAWEASTFWGYAQRTAAPDKFLPRSRRKQQKKKTCSMPQPACH